MHSPLRVSLVPIAAWAGAWLAIVVVHGQVTDDCSSFDNCRDCASSSCMWCKSDSECHNQGSFCFGADILRSKDCPDWSWSATAIAGAILGVVFILTSISGIVFCMLRRHNLSRQPPPAIIFVPQAYGVGPDFPQQPPTVALAQAQGQPSAHSPAEYAYPAQSYQEHAEGAPPPVYDPAQTEGSEQSSPQFEGQPHQMSYKEPIV